MGKFLKTDLKIDLSQFEALQGKVDQAMDGAFKTIAGELDGRFNQAMSGDGNWVWPRPSKRGVQGDTLGEKAKAWRDAEYDTGSPRSINDTGQLSGTKNIEKSDRDWLWTWGQYGLFVHEGAWIHPWGNLKAAKVLLPARPWTTAVLHGHPHYQGEVYDFEGRLRDEIIRRLT